MKKTTELTIKNTTVRITKINGEDYICLTDMAKMKSEDAQQTIGNWMRNRMTIEYLGLWEELYNPDFKPLEFEGFRREVGLNSFTISPTKWITSTGAIGRWAMRRVARGRTSYVRGGRAHARPSRARCPRPQGGRMQSGISPQRIFIGSSTIGPTGQPDIRPSDGDRDEARLSP